MIAARRNTHRADDPIAARLGLLGTEEACIWQFLVEELVFEYGYRRGDAEETALEQVEQKLAKRRLAYH